MLILIIIINTSREVKGLQSGENTLFSKVVGETRYMEGSKRMLYLVKIIRVRSAAGSSI